MDRHRIKPNGDFIVGGFKIPCSYGLVGHSDGDALIHSIIDALLGAMNRGDIGKHFPPSSERWLNEASSSMLEKTLEFIEQGGWTIVNIDSTVCVEQIKLAPYREKIENSLGQYLNPGVITNVKFKTGEGEGPVGQGDVMDAHCVVLIQK